MKMCDEIDGSCQVVTYPSGTWTKLLLNCYYTVSKCSTENCEYYLKREHLVLTFPINIHFFSQSGQRSFSIFFMFVNLISTQHCSLAKSPTLHCLQCHSSQTIPTNLSNQYLFYFSPHIAQVVLVWFVSLAPCHRSTLEKVWEAKFEIL